MSIGLLPNFFFIGSPEAQAFREARVRFLLPASYLSAAPHADCLLYTSQYGFGKITEGTIYPILLRLEKNGMIRATYRQSDVGPKRKYYSLTEDGETEFQSFLTSYRELSAAVAALLADVKGGNDHE